MNTIDILGEDEALKRMIERTITEFEDNALLIIGSRAFSTCSGLTSVSFPKATSIGDYAFNSCTGLTSVSFPNATSIGDYAFNSCTGLTSVSFPNATSIYRSSFGGCTGLTSVSFPKATSIGDFAFYGCSELTSVSFPKATRIDDSAFSYCSNLVSVSFPEATSIGKFQNCTSLVSVDFPKATSVGNSAFYKCTSLVSASFPLLKSLDSSAFSECTSLATIYIGTKSNTVCTLSSSYIPPSVTDIYVPLALVDSYKTATNWSSFADKIKWYEQPVACQSLTITADDVAGYQTTTTIHWEATCTYSIEGIMQPGTMVFKGDVTSDTFSKNPSSDSSRSIEVSYTFLGKTATTTITQSKYVGDPVGGAIFYIDDTADGAYEFYDAEGNVISSVAVGDSPALYKVLTPGAKDKYYICNTTLYTRSRWTYYKNGNYVHNDLGTGTAIGTGKTNTSTVMSADSGAYIASNSNGYPTIWYQLQQTRSVTGCNDWFVPSKDEMEAVRTSGIMSFSSQNIWSSSEVSDGIAWYWNVNNWMSNNYKEDKVSVFFVRAF